MKNDGDTKVIIANAPYPNTLSKFDAYIPLGMYSGWLEDGQEIAATVTLQWNENPPELQLNVVNLNFIGNNQVRIHTTSLMGLLNFTTSTK